MAVDHIRYDILAQEALRDMIRKVLADVAKTGLKGDHHFNITFATGVPGVRMPPRLREKYPKEMTIVLQYQFWDLKVAQDAFEVGLSFGGVAERVTVPFVAITSFADPSVQFALQFQAAQQADEPAAPADDTEAATDQASEKPRSAVPATPAGATVPSVPASAPADAAAAPPADKPAAPTSGAEVVRLDRFRKK